MAWNFPGAWNGAPPPPGQTFETGWGTSATNGTAGTVFFTVNASLYSVGNVTEWGYGANVRCTMPYTVVLQSPSTYGGGGHAIPTISNVSDLGEATNISILNTPDNVSTVVFFNNGFSSENARNISTCLGPAQVLPFESSFLTVGLPFVVGNQTITHQYVLPFMENFTYEFPANFGTWQVDSLASGSGAPGGGLAFSYSPCV